jgi:hypothetical protein
MPEDETALKSLRIVKDARHPAARSKIKVALEIGSGAV